MKFSLDNGRIVRTTYLLCASARREETWILGCGRIDGGAGGVDRSTEPWLEGGLRVELEVQEESV